MIICTYVNNVWQYLALGAKILCFFTEVIHKFNI